MNAGIAECMNTLIALIGRQIGIFYAINARQRLVGAILVIARAVPHWRH